MGNELERLKTFRSLYIDIFNHTTVGLILVDQEGVIKDTNVTLRNLLGYSQKNELRDKHIKMCHINQQNFVEFQRLSKLIYEGESIFKQEFQLLAKSGKYIWCEISGTLLNHDDRMKNCGILWDIVDITQKVKDRELIVEQNKKLRELNDDLCEQVLGNIKHIKDQDTILAQTAKLAMMGEMMDAIAHQWRQPLSIIKLAADELKYISEAEYYSKEDLNETRLRIVSQVEHLIETLHEFRDFFRPKTTIESINIKSVIDSSLHILKDELMQYSITVQITGDFTIEAKLIPNEFKHIIINLVNNAKDQYIIHNIKPRVIDIELSKDEQYVYVRVIDQAGGIPKEYIENLFEANFSTKDGKLGTGIGLYMSKNILEKIGADIEATNVEDGASFIIRIPL